jgi:hypothetical protein
MFKHLGYISLLAFVVFKVAAQGAIIIKWQPTSAHIHNNANKIRFMYSQKWNSDAVSQFPLWAILHILLIVGIYKSLTDKWM